MASFSADRTPQHMPARLSPNTGNMGAQAAQQQGKRGSKSQMGRPSPGGGNQANHQVGRPAPEPDPTAKQDLSHLPIALQHYNMKGLGRDLPYITWANLTGNYRQYAEPGRVPFDIFED